MSSALAELAETIGRACLKFAEDLRQGDVRQAELTLEPVSDAIEELGLGERQRQMIAILRVAADDGLTTAEIAQQMGGHDPANAHMSLRGLHGRRVVEEVPNKRPIRWRLTPPYRATADPYLAIANHVRSGEWTTYGDVSIAVRGDTMGARAVGRAAATLEAFPNPHRILRVGGVIPDEWRTTDSRVPNPEVCRRRLEAEGVRFDEFGRAMHENYVPWHALLARSEHDLGT
jgi:alkylated DNA nucleotide flippase Atl1